MNSREKILSAVIANQPELTRLPDLSYFEGNASASLEKFAEVLKLVGGFFYDVSSYDEVGKTLLAIHGENKKIISAVNELPEYYDDGFVTAAKTADMQDIDIAILKGRFGVAENGAVWITEKEMRQRALPFICQHLAIILEADNIVANMHDAYNLIADTDYGFGTFIAGPSKTADIEQSLVIGAHGPRSLSVFVIRNQ